MNIHSKSCVPSARRTSDSSPFQPWTFFLPSRKVVSLGYLLPASRLREVNRIIEDTAWGPYRTEFYPTYDYKAVGMAEHDKATAN